ncbi:prephenate dehydrogenase [Phreatobacter sp. AB_2022a]|uniref:prephenate dehydrogenase n=1 Tax=Phreatobacter sp. AB_2022a TaxID=3003134 RepID=UPI0022875733|nr:prephenate dehydrogenase [Phreatobacter sp. AB_2022a]MCZ0736660.1 prephenate dehydrogenase [Phreatobacter sp. AB_2022a]
MISTSHHLRSSDRGAPARALPSVGLIGLGAFGRLMVRHLAPHLPLTGYDPAFPEAAGTGPGGIALASLATVAAADIVVLATPVDRLARVIAAIGPHLKPGAVVLDVGSVKVGPADIMRRSLPDHVEIVGTHPLFGPQSARAGIAGLKIAVCPIRGRSALRIAAFLRRTLRLKVIVTTPEAHDREAAMVQGLTHLIAKVLVRMEPLPTRMTTASFDLVARAVEMVRYDAPEVFLAIERDNPFAADVRRRFFALAAEVDAALDRGHS